MKVRGLENQDTVAMQRWLSMVNACSLCVYLLGRVITVHVWVFCQWCVHALADLDLEALWMPTGIH